MTYTLKDRMIYDLQKLKTDRVELETLTNPLVLEWKRRSVANMERLLAHLPERDRIIIEQLVIEKKRAADITEQTGLSVKEINSAKNDILSYLCSLRYGVAFHE